MTTPMTDDTGRHVKALPPGDALAPAPLAATDLVPAGTLGLAAELGTLVRVAEMLCKARGMIPEKLAQAGPGAVLATILTGRELGIGPMAAIRGIHIIEGKATLSGEMLLALALRAGVRATWLETTGTVARLRLTRDGDEYVGTFTLEDARRAGVAGKAVWKSYPDAMLRARCISASVRAFCPDVAVGTYTPEELEAAPRAEYGDVIEAAQAAHEPTPREQAIATAKPWAAFLDGLIASASGDLEAADAELGMWIEEHRTALAALPDEEVRGRIVAKLVALAKACGHMDPEAFVDGATAAPEVTP